VPNRGLKLAKYARGTRLVSRDANSVRNIYDCYHAPAHRPKEQHERPWYLRSSKQERDAAEAALPPLPPLPYRRRRWSQPTRPNHDN
jgi:hypothetical protein